MPCLKHHGRAYGAGLNPVADVAPVIGRSATSRRAKGVFTVRRPKLNLSLAPGPETAVVVSEPIRGGRAATIEMLRAGGTVISSDPTNLRLELDRLHLRYRTRETDAFGSPLTVCFELLGGSSRGTAFDLVR
jgi:hypothetical protein